MAVLYMKQTFLDIPNLFHYIELSFLVLSAYLYQHLQFFHHLYHNSRLFPPLLLNKLMSDLETNGISVFYPKEYFLTFLSFLLSKLLLVFRLFEVHLLLHLEIFFLLNFQYYQQYCFFLVFLFPYPLFYLSRHRINLTSLLNQYILFSQQYAPQFLNLFLKSYPSTIFATHQFLFLFFLPKKIPLVSDCLNYYSFQITSFSLKFYFNPHIIFFK